MVPILCETDPRASPRAPDHPHYVAFCRVGPGSLRTLQESARGLDPTFLSWSTNSLSGSRQGKHKLAPRWEGSYLVVEVIRIGVYQLQEINGATFPNVWNIK
jgi:hypothetical protein